MSSEPSSNLPPDISRLFEKHKPAEWDFFQLLRCVENRCRRQPKIGTSVSPSQDPLRLTQTPALHFAPAAVERFESATAERPPRLHVRFFGIFGSNGPMPLALTAFVRNRLRHFRDGALNAFLNIFQHRLYCLFYRAWAVNHKATDLDRPEDSRFRFYFGSLIGQAEESMQERDAVPDTAKLYYSGRLMGKHAQADGLAAVLNDYFQVPVLIGNWNGHWYHLHQSDQCQLGVSSESTSLGLGAVVGERLWDVQSRFRVVLGPLSWSRFQDFLPGQLSRTRLEAWLKYYTGQIVEAEIQLLLKGPETPPTHLSGGSHLGWNSWLESTPSTDVRSECLFAPRL